MIGGRSQGLGRSLIFLIIMVEIKETHLHKALDELREVINWLTVLEKEYGMTKKDAKTTRSKVTKVVKALEKGLK